MSSARPGFTVRIVRTDADTVRPLRQRVLRPGRPAEDVTYSADAEAAHFAAYDPAGTVVGVATAFPEPHPVTGEAGWRLRGMAVEESVRGTGCGSQVLAATMAHARDSGARLIWCNARVGALAFYTRHGFVAEAGAFEIPGGGPHRRLRQELTG